MICSVQFVKSLANTFANFLSLYLYFLLLFLLTLTYLFELSMGNMRFLAHWTLGSISKESTSEHKILE